MPENSLLLREVIWAMFGCCAAMLLACVDLDDDCCALWLQGEVLERRVVSTL